MPPVSYAGQLFLHHGEASHDCRVLQVGSSVRIPKAVARSASWEQPGSRFICKAPTSGSIPVSFVALRFVHRPDRVEGRKQRQSGRRVVMKSQRPTQAKDARRLSDAIIAKRYLELQRLRDEVRKAEISCAIDARYSKRIKRSAFIEIENRRRTASNVA
jgi:hypothetical protein